MPLDPSLDPVIDAAGQMYNVDPAHLRAIALAESSGDPKAVSPAGAKGLMQLMPDTAKGLGVGNVMDPVESILGGAKYYAQGLAKYGNPTQALMYYHGGPDEGGWGAATQAYPGQVAAAYAKSQQPASDRTQVAANTAQPLTGTDALAAVSKPPPPNSIAARRPDLAAANARAEGVPSATSTMPIAASPDLYAPRSAGANANEHFGPGVQVAQNAAAPALTGTDALAAVGRQPQRAQPQTAQAGGMSDDELWNGFVNGTLPFLKPGAQPAPPQAGPSQANGPSPSQPAAPSNAPPKSLSRISQEYITWAQQEAERYAALGRPAPPQITAAAGMSPGLPGSPR